MSGARRVSHPETFSICAASDKSVLLVAGAADGLDAERQAILDRRPVVNHRLLSINRPNRDLISKARVRCNFSSRFR
ncbi:hypothetical protein X762_06080 [Mesorhizobium sp. LSHC426A00]|nr:hypothetical protein X761_27110 [Mesorhizobium sp. LSHC424B00]ESX51375.1 hypothetical protein X762_06080 [Mesorhizobium sp. LSHC426A00]